MKTSKIDINKQIEKAEEKINSAIDCVTSALRKVLIAGGIPEDIAEKYSAQPVHGGEWILNDEDGWLAGRDIHLLSNNFVIDIVKDLENLD